MAKDIQWRRVGGGEVWQALRVVELVAETAVKLEGEEEGNVGWRRALRTVKCLLGWGRGWHIFGGESRRR